MRTGTIVFCKANFAVLNYRNDNGRRNARIDDIAAIAYHCALCRAQTHWSAASAAKAIVVIPIVKVKRSHRGECKFFRSGGAQDFVIIIFKVAVLA